MDLPESAFSPGPDKVYDRNKGKWVDIKDVPLWELVISTPFFWIFAVLAGIALSQWIVDLYRWIFG